VLDTLRELKLDTNTLVFFTSDNGPWLIKGADGGSAGPLRGGKGSTWEGGMREPTLAWWPGKIQPGSVCAAVAGTIDLLPTCVTIAGGTVPAKPVIDGRDISPLLFGKSTQSQREAHFYFHGYNLQAVRQGPWKLAIAPQPETMGKGVSTDASGKAPRLYNLDEDIGERTNVADKHPEIVAKLKALAEKFDAEITANRRPAGETANPRTLYPSEGGKAPGKPGKGKKANSKTVALESLHPGDTLAADAAPQIVGKSFTLSCVVETTQADAVLVAHGGKAVGYALYLKDGRPVFAIRNGQAIREIAAPDAVAGATRLAGTLAADHAMTLSVNDKVVGTGKANGLLTRQPQEDFCVGHDNGEPVANYPAHRSFQGTISQLKVVIP
jgi:hypothetical protein